MSVDKKAETEFRLMGENPVLWHVFKACQVDRGLAARIAPVLTADEVAWLKSAKEALR